MKEIILFDKIHSGFWRFKGIITLLILFTILSCNREEYNAKEDQLPTNDDITFRDGRLIFKDDIAFNNHQRWLLENQANPQLIAEKNKLLGLKSMTEYYTEGMKLDEMDPLFAEYVAKYPSVFLKESYENSTLYLLPHSKLLCYVANVNGIFQIGDHIYRIAQNYIYQTGDESKIAMLFLPIDQISTKDVLISLSQPNLDAKHDYGNKTVNFNNDNRFRIVSSLRDYTVYDGNTGITFWYYDIITNPQKRNWTGIYFRAQLNTKSANDNGYIKVDCPGCTQQPIYASQNENTGLSQDVIYYGPDYQLDMSASFCAGYSRGRLIDDGTEYIYILWGDALESPPTSCTVTHTNDLNDPF